MEIVSERSEIRNTEKAVINIAVISPDGCAQRKRRFIAPVAPRHLLTRAACCFIFIQQMAIAGTANAAGFCAEMHRLIEQAESNFLERPAQGTGVNTPAALSNADTCSMARALSGANTFHCAWKFPYRVDAASDAFNKLDGELRVCFDELTELPKDLGVNHPDFYDLRQYQIDQVVVTLSLKDKSALRQTYVFIGVQGLAHSQPAKE